MTGLHGGVRCPDCGTDILSEPGMPGLCPQCLLSLALKESPAASPGDPGSESAPGEAATLDRLSAGRILGERYQVRELLGRGGMGEVFRAFDLKLRVDVALKAVRPEMVESERARELLRREVRTAREVVSPNVCRIFDLVAEDGQELVSMEYVDGVTLGETLKSRGPLALQEAREIALQFLSGLEAIHQAGLVHRDFKPENVMVTRAGRVVVMDFGLAKLQASGGGGTISGTPAYMSPEQARGDALDARADVYAAGVVLAEMLTVGGADHVEQRQALWRGVREVPPRVPDGPWASVLRQVLSPIPEERPGSARELSRALEEVTQRLPGFETTRPYPGLSSFTEEDAEYFFGRELEVEALLTKLRRPRLLALVAPSGAGKSSFLRAGLLPALPKGWKAIVTAPGSRPFQALAQALAPAFAGDAQAVQALLRFEEPEVALGLFQRFRQRHEHALLVVDQFEELFTLCPEEVQQRFASLLSRLVLEADLHVILSLRDDFLYRCRDHEPLVPAFSDLTPLARLDEGALRRALVQPALLCGYRFEDDSLVDEMIDAVQTERGALPLLAFAASRLWERRERETGQITRATYREIGGVAGALARHAEATLERIGSQRVPIVRELFRNLVTAEGTRAVREREELLSVFGAANPVQTQLSGSDSGRGAAEAASRTEAERVLDALLDARLLTSYERAGERGETHRQVEIVHESLLQAWPRLQRWQTQDADGAQLRDQLRQAAQLWQDRGQPEDLLWSGTAYRDFALWRERYSAPLTAAEEAFATAATRRAERRRRRRRMAVAAIVAGLSVGLGVLAVLWNRAETARVEAERAALRAEASKLVTLGESERANFATGALAYAIKSLELADSEAARRLALRVLQQAPVARIARVGQGKAEGGKALGLDFSPDGEWVATGGYTQSEVLHRDGERRLVLEAYRSGGQQPFEVLFAPTSDRLAANRRGDVRVWSIPDGRELRRLQLDEGGSGIHLVDGGFATFTAVGRREVIRFWPWSGEEPRLVAETEAFRVGAQVQGRLAYAQGRKLFLRPFDDWSAAPRLLAEHPAGIWDVKFDRTGQLLSTSDSTGSVRIWELRGGRPEPRLSFEARDTPALRFDPSGRWLSASGAVDGYPTIRLFDLQAPPGTAPLVLQRNDVFFMNELAFDKTGSWLATAHANDVAFWWLGGERPRVITRAGRGGGLAFTPDGDSLLVTSADGVRVWPLTGGASGEPKHVFAGPLAPWPVIAVDPHGTRAVVAGPRGRVHVVPLDGGPARELPGFSNRVDIGVVAFGDDGRLVAAAPYIGPAEEKVIRVWNLETDDVQVLGPMPGAGEDFLGGVGDSIGALSFLGTERILASPLGAGLVSFDLKTGVATRLARWPRIGGVLNHSGTAGVGLTTSRPDEQLTDSSSWEVIGFQLGGTPVPLRTHGTLVSGAAFDPTDRMLATGGTDGTVRIGPASGEAPHLLLGHQGRVLNLAFSPDGRWLATSTDDGTVRLWPVPDVTRPPVHTLPLETLLAKLRTHTNLRAVPDAQSGTGYKLEVGPFPGWAKPPEW